MDLNGGHPCSGATPFARCNPAGPRGASGRDAAALKVPNDTYMHMSMSWIGATLVCLAAATACGSPDGGAGQEESEVRDGSRECANGREEVEGRYFNESEAALVQIANTIADYDLRLVTDADGAAGLLDARARRPFESA